MENKKNEMKSIAEGFTQFYYFPCTHKVSEEHITLCLKKDEFPYEWLDCYYKLDLPVHMLLLKDHLFPEELGLRTVHNYLAVYLACDWHPDS